MPRELSPRAANSMAFIDDQRLRTVVRNQSIPKYETPVSHNRSQPNITETVRGLWWGGVGGGGGGVGGWVVVVGRLAERESAGGATLLRLTTASLSTSPGVKGKGRTKVN